jgi:cell division protein FtsW (lipid II flippase)
MTMRKVAEVNCAAQPCDVASILRNGRVDCTNAVQAKRRTWAMERKSRLWYLLLLVPIVAMIWVPSYNHAAPAIGGVPFFYWYQLLWIVIGAVLTLVVYLATER